MQGLVEVKKIYKDGTEELVCRDNNILTDGLGYNIINIFTDTGSDDIVDHLVGYFQVGVGRLDPSAQPENKQKYISNLMTPLTIEAYGDSTDSDVGAHKLYKIHKSPFVPSLEGEVESTTFVTLPDAYSSHVIDDVVHYRLNLGEETANGFDISEFGLFVRNPDGDIGEDTSVLIAYKNFKVGHAIPKTSDYSLVIDWQIKCIDETVNTEVPPASATQYNVVFIMLDDVGLDYLSLYDEVNPYDLSGQTNANSNPFSQIEDAVDGCGIYPHTPCLSALTTSGLRFMNARAMPTCSPTRSSVLTGMYNFSCKNKNQGDPTSPGIWGPGMGSVPMPTARRSRGGVAALNSTYSLLPVADPENPGPVDVQPFEELVLGGDGSQNQIGNTRVFADYMRNRGYGSSFFGKWHLAPWEDQTVYCEEGTPVVMGEGWDHINSVGRWDHYVATWANLRGNGPVPWREYTTGYWDWNGWPNFQLQGSPGTEYYANGGEMGYVNFFADVNGTVVTVSDSGYVPPALSASATVVAFNQGSPENFATTFIFDHAQKHFNSSAVNPEPFFMYIAPNAPHDPWTFPPKVGVYNTWYKDNHMQLLEDGTAADAGGERLTPTVAASASWVTVNSQLEHFDYTLSAFLDGLKKEIKERTIFIITADNGSVLGDMDKRAAWGIEGIQSNRLGTTFSSMIDLENYAYYDISPSNVRRGGTNDSNNGFKASLYDTGTKVPMIAYGPSAGIPTNETTHAFVDLTDILATVVDAGGGSMWDIPSDSISFFNLLTGHTDATNHPRKYSYGEQFYPNGAGFGNAALAGSHTGQSLICVQDEGGSVGTGDPVVPKYMARCLAVRHLKEDYTVRPKPQIADDVFKNVGFTGTYDETGAMLEASAGTWKIVRPSSSGPNFQTGGIINIGKGRLYEELYHLQDAAFNNRDINELNDMIPEEWKGEVPPTGEIGPLILSGLIASAISDVGLAGHLDSSVHFWNLARIYDVIRQELAYFIQYRRSPATSILTIPDEEAFVGDENT